MAGRPIGSKGNIGRKIALMVEQALDMVGGAEYLKQQAKENPAAFMAMASKLMPKDINFGNQEDEDGKPKELKVSFINGNRATE